MRSHETRGLVIKNSSQSTEILNKTKQSSAGTFEDRLQKNFRETASATKDLIDSVFKTLRLGADDDNQSSEQNKPLNNHPRLVKRTSVTNGIYITNTRPSPLASTRRSESCRIKLNRSSSLKRPTTSRAPQSSYLSLNDQSSGKWTIDSLTASVKRSLKAIQQNGSSSGDKKSTTEISIIRMRQLGLMRRPSRQSSLLESLGIPRSPRRQSVWASNARKGSLSLSQIFILCAILFIGILANGAPIIEYPIDELAKATLQVPDISVLQTDERTIPLESDNNNYPDNDPSIILNDDQSDDGDLDGVPIFLIERRRLNRDRALEPAPWLREQPMRRNSYPPNNDEDIPMTTNQATPQAKLRSLRQGAADEIYNELLRQLLLGLLEGDSLSETDNQEELLTQNIDQQRQQNPQQSGEDSVPGDDIALISGYEMPLNNEASFVNLGQATGQNHRSAKLLDSSGTNDQLKTSFTIFGPKREQDYGSLERDSNPSLLPAEEPGANFALTPSETIASVANGLGDQIPTQPVTVNSGDSFHIVEDIDRESPLEQSYIPNGFMMDAGEQQQQQQQQQLNQRRLALAMMNPNRFNSEGENGWNFVGSPIMKMKKRKMNQNTYDIYRILDPSITNVIGPKGWYPQMYEQQEERLSSGRELNNSKDGQDIQYQALKLLKGGSAYMNPEYDESRTRPRVANSVLDTEVGDVLLFSWLNNDINKNGRQRIDQLSEYSRPIGLYNTNKPINVKDFGLDRSNQINMEQANSYLIDSGPIEMSQFNRMDQPLDLLSKLRASNRLRSRMKFLDNLKLLEQAPVVPNYQAPFETDSYPSLAYLVSLLNRDDNTKGINLIDKIKHLKVPMSKTTQESFEKNSAPPETSRGSLMDSTLFLHIALIFAAIIGIIVSIKLLIKGSNAHKRIVCSNSSFFQGRGPFAYITSRRSSDSNNSTTFRGPSMGTKDEAGTQRSYRGSEDQSCSLNDDHDDDDFDDQNKSSSSSNGLYGLAKRLSSLLNHQWSFKSQSNEDDDSDKPLQPNENDKEAKDVGLNIENATESTTLSESGDSGVKCGEPYRSSGSYIKSLVDALSKARSRIPNQFMIPGTGKKGTGILDDDDEDDKLDHELGGSDKNKSSDINDPGYGNMVSQMDISAAHLILSYMEEHLEDKERLRREWIEVNAAHPFMLSLNNNHNHSNNNNNNKQQTNIDSNSNKLGRLILERMARAALSKENRNKNRNLQVVPFDSNRVKLGNSDLGNRKFLSGDYINASYIYDDDPRRATHIIAQGPLESTVTNFWQMVWEQGVSVIVMLTRLTENNVEMCHCYWPTDAHKRQSVSNQLQSVESQTDTSSTNSRRGSVTSVFNPVSIGNRNGQTIVANGSANNNMIQFEFSSTNQTNGSKRSDEQKSIKFEVHLVSEHVSSNDYIVRNMYMINRSTGETRTITQFHYLAWPKSSTPDNVKSLLQFRRKVHKSYRNAKSPILVHSCDGAGRSGTYTLIDIILERIRNGAKEIDPRATLEHLRDQRLGVCSTLKQFEFVLVALAEEIQLIIDSLPQ